ncbi:aldehyde dehydrogenase family protein [Sorangium sp. So ce394]|uniref:aldehyde dehydrogenase family protein n=1 Tax=Sorangium sp. So ce394 TaxID=3133310 RepID=UPI003F5C8CAA
MSLRSESFGHLPVELTVQGALRSAGEKCTATSRAIVVETMGDELTRRAVERVGRLKLGPGTDPGAHLGPLISEAARAGARVRRSGANRGGARAVGGAAPGGPEPLVDGHSVLPTVLDRGHTSRPRRSHRSFAR